MNYDDWEMLWRRQEPPIGKAADLEALKETFEPKRRKLARAVLVRNLLEPGSWVGSVGGPFEMHLNLF